VPGVHSVFTRGINGPAGYVDPQRRDAEFLSGRREKRARVAADVQHALATQRAEIDHVCKVGHYAAAPATMSRRDLPAQLEVWMLEVVAAVVKRRLPGRGGTRKIRPRAAPRAGPHTTVFELYGRRAFQSGVADDAFLPHSHDAASLGLSEPLRR
jgi:hypothetical protein